MRLRKKIIADIKEYLRLHYAEPKPSFPTVEARSFAPHEEESAARGVCSEDSSVVMEEREEEKNPAPQAVMPVKAAAPPGASAPVYRSRVSAPNRSNTSAPCWQDEEDAQPLPSKRAGLGRMPQSFRMPCDNTPNRSKPPASAPQYQAPMPTAAYGDLSERLNTLDESFQEALLRLIDERGMKDSACYKRAGVDRKLFSKIRSNPSYRPSKATAVAFAIALELNLDETVDLLRKAGYALSHSSKFDVIVEYFIVKGRFSLRELNEALYEFDQPLVNG